MDGYWEKILPPARLPPPPPPKVIYVTNPPPAEVRLIVRGILSPSFIIGESTGHLTFVIHTISVACRFREIETLNSINPYKYHFDLPIIVKKKWHDHRHCWLLRCTKYTVRCWMLFISYIIINFINFISVTLFRTLNLRSSQSWSIHFYLVLFVLRNFLFVIECWSHHIVNTSFILLYYSDWINNSW